MSPTTRKLLAPIALLVVGLPAGIGAVMALGDHSEPPVPAPFTAVSQGAHPTFTRHAEPRWELVSRITGKGAGTRSFAIMRRAIQWRADWSCKSGTFRMTAGGAVQPRKVMVSTDCPHVSQETSSGTGAGSLNVNASGAWRVSISQQVDSALQEPKSVGMTSAAVIARGSFHSIQKHAEGSVVLYGTSDGRLVLRFEHLYVSPSMGLRVWLSSAKNVHSTLEARRARYIDAGNIRSTLGTYNQVLAAGIKADRFHSVVIWCPTVLIAFGAAPLA